MNINDDRFDKRLDEKENRKYYFDVISVWSVFRRNIFEKHKVAHIQKSLVIQSKTKEKLKVLIDNKKKTLSEIQIFYYFLNSIDFYC